jgi:hypothetical protein
MKLQTKAYWSVFIRPLFFWGLIIAGVLIWLGLRTDHGRQIISLAPTPINIVTSSAPANHPVLLNPVPTATTNAASSPLASRLPGPTIPWFRPHPFPVSKSSGAFEWTAEDGKDTNVILQLAHNELEYQRMVTENATIFRRQLVYHTEPFTLLAQKAIQSGQSIQQITLPGLDGQLLPVVVTRTDLKDGGNQGQVYGQLPGQPDSMVTMAFVSNREAFTVISPQDKIYLQAESHDPSQIVVKSINPNTYGVITR